MNDSIANTYSDARSEYTKQLCQLLVPSYFQWYLTVLDKARTASAQEPKKLLWHFQTLLNGIPEWNMEKVTTEIGQLQTSCGCDYLEDLLTAVFIAHTKVLTSIRVSNKQKKVQITVPKVEHFLFKVLCESSKLLWGSSFLFREGISSIEKQQNYRSIEGLLGEGIIQAVRNMIPVKSILRDFVSVDDDDEGDGECSASGSDIPTAATDATVATVATVTAATDATAAISEQQSVAADLSGTELLQPILSVTEIPVTDISLTDMSDIDVSGSATTDPPIFMIDTSNKPRVDFANYNSVFDSDHPDGSDMVEETGDDELPGLEILEDAGIPLEMGDVEDLEKHEDAPQSLGADEFDVLV